MESSNDRKSTTKSPDYLVFSIILNVVKITRPLRSYRTPNIEPKLYVFRTISKKSHSKELNAFSKSVTSNIPVSFLILAYCMLSKIVLIFFTYTENRNDK